MKLKSQEFNITDSKGNDINLSGKDDKVLIKLNDEITETRLHHIFGFLELNENEIYGNSLLSYYNIEDGKLVVEGSTVQFIMADTKEPILIKSITRPIIRDDSVIPFEHIQKFATFFNILKPEEVFTDLNNEEKQIFIDERLAKSKAKEIEDNQAKQAIIAAEKAAAEQQKEIERKEAENQANKAKAEAEAKAEAQAEAELKASLDPKLVHNKKSYISQQGFYRGIDFKEYIDGPYHLFYGQSEDEQPFVLIKRGADWWEEPADTLLADQTDKTIDVQFTDHGVVKNISLNTDTGETTITDILE